MQYLQTLFDTNVLPLYKEIVSARSVNAGNNRSQIDTFVLAKNLRETNLYTLDKAYHKSTSPKSEANYLIPIALKRYHPSSVTLEIRPKNSRGVYTSVTRYDIAENELEVMKKVNDSVFIQKLLEVFEKDEVSNKIVVGKETWLKFEYSTVGSLSEVLQNTKVYISVPQVAAIVSQVVRAFEFIHERQIVHGEVTTKNILLFQPGVVKLSNFALSVDLSSTELENLPSEGPLYYTAPEKLRRLSAELRNDESFHVIEYNQKIDIWSLGVVMLELFLKVPPLFKATAESQILQERYRLFLTDLGSPQRSKGSALYHLFYPHYDLVKAQMENNTPLDIDILIEHIPLLKNSPTDLLVVLMGHKDDKLRYKAPTESILPRFQKLWSISSCFDFIRQCLFINYEYRPTAEDLSQHPFLNNAYREIIELEPDLTTIIDRYRTREGKKSVWLEFITGHSLQQVNNFIQSYIFENPSAIIV